MSTTTPTTHHEIGTVPRLTGAAAAVWTALTNHPGTTSTTLATTAAIGRSTAGKTLTTLEKQGLAYRKPGNKTGNRRPADLWYPATTPADHTTSRQDGQHPDHNQANNPTDDTAPAPQASAPAANSNITVNDEKTTASSEPQTPDLPTDTPDTTGDTAADTPADDSTTATEPPPAGPANDTEQTTNDTTLADSTSIAPAAVAASGSKTRLASGALRQMVLDHLTAHPDQAFTSARISRAVERSSGAIANALVKLHRQSLIEQVTERPLTYRITPQHTNHP
jgi:hypothetical protein